jgi:hypothetical protein
VVALADVHVEAVGRAHSSCACAGSLASSSLSSRDIGIERGLLDSSIALRTR